MVDSWVTGPLNILQHRRRISGGPLPMDIWVTESLYTGVPAAALDKHEVAPSGQRVAERAHGYLAAMVDTP